MSACVVHSKPAEARHGLLCDAHFERLDDMLRAIEDEAAMLSAVPSMAIQTGSGGGSLASERAPARLEVLAALDPRTKRWEPETEQRYVPPAPKQIGPWCLFCDHETCTAWRAGRRRDLHDDEQDAGSAMLASVLEELHNWARLVREERELQPPDAVTISGERHLLVRHLEWIAEQPWVDECFGDIRKLLGLLQDVNKTKPDRPAGSCFLLTETGVCGGKIWRRATRHTAWRVVFDRCTQESVDLSDGPAYCESCGQEWDGADLDRLNLILEQQRKEAARPKTDDGSRMLTAEELSSQLRISLNAVRIIVSRKRIPNVKGYYDPGHFADRYGKASA